MVEAEAVFVLDGGDEVGGVKAEMIVADAGVEAEQASGSLSGFGGLARCFDLDGTEGVGADAHQKLSIGRLSDVEAIEEGYGLIGLSTGDMRLAALVLNDAGNEVERVAVVVGDGINDVENVETANGFPGGDLRGIDGGRRFMDVDDFADFLLMNDSDFERRAGCDLKADFGGSVVALFLDSKLMRTCGNEGEMAAAGEIGFAVHRGKRTGLKRDARGRYSDSILIVDGDSENGRGRGLGKGRPKQGETKQENTHS